MGLFKKQVKFISAICPECKGHLELDGNLERAFCQYCGAQCIVENVQRKERKRTNLETVLDFVERQQNLRRQDKQEQQRRRAEEEKKSEEFRKKHLWIFIALMVGVMVFGLVVSILAEQGII